MTEEFKLDPKSHQEIFVHEIVPELLAGARRQEVPIVFLLGGQPGVGKSSTKEFLAEVLAHRGRVLDFSADLMRPYHPRFDELLQGDERVLRALDTAIDQDAREWVDKAIVYSIEMRADVIFDSNLANPDRARAIATQFTAAGYQTEAVFIAGSSALSRLGVLERYQRQVDTHGAGAYCPTEIQERNYAGVLETARRMDDGEIPVEAVHVYRRGGGRSRRPGQA